MVFEPGRLAMKTAGRENGKYCVVLTPINKDHVLITGPKPVTGVRRRKCNVFHLEPIPKLLKLKKDASDNDVLDAFKKEKVYDLLGIDELSEADLKKWEEDQRTRETKKKAKEAKNEEEKHEKEKPKESVKEVKKEEPKEKHVEKKPKAPAKKAENTKEDKAPEEKK